MYFYLLIQQSKISFNNVSYRTWMRFNTNSNHLNISYFLFIFIVYYCFFFKINHSINRRYLWILVFTLIIQCHLFFCCIVFITYFNWSTNTKITSLFISIILPSKFLTFLLFIFLIWLIVLVFWEKLFINKTWFLF
jgi:hypothetical protein